MQGPMAQCLQQRPEVPKPQRMPCASLRSQAVGERLKGFKFALARRGIAFDDGMLLETSADDARNGYEADGYAAGERLLPLAAAGRVGVFAVGDSLAVGLMRRLLEAGVEVPGKVGICGFDGIDQSRLVGIQLTTVAQDVDGVGRRAAQLAIERIREPASEPRQVTMPVALMRRGTTGPAGA